MVQRNLAAALEGPAAGGGGVLGASSGSLRQYSRVSRTELVCLAASSCGFTDPNSRDVSNSGTPESSKRSSLDEKDPPGMVEKPAADLPNEKVVLNSPPGQNDRGPLGAEQQVVGIVGGPGRKPRWSGRDPSPLKPRSGSAGPIVNLTRLEEVPAAEKSVATVQQDEFGLVMDPSLEDGIGKGANGTLVDEEEPDASPLADRDGGRSPTRSPRHYKTLAPAPLRVAAESGPAAHRRSFSQMLPERNSSSAPATDSPSQRTKTETLSPQQGARGKPLGVPPGGTDQDRSPANNRPPERPVPDPLSSQSRAAAAALTAARGIKVGPGKPRLEEGVALDAATLERLTEAITEQVLNHLATPLSGTSSFSSSRGSPSGQDRAQRSMSASPPRGAGWGPWRVPAPGIPPGAASRDSSGKTSPGGSRSPRGRMAFTEFAAQEDGWGREESRFAMESTFPGAAGSRHPSEGRHVAGFPWQLDSLSRSYSEDGIAARYVRESLEARAPPSGWADVNSDVGSGGRTSMRRSGSWSSFESTYVPGFDGLRPGMTSAEADDLPARVADGSMLADVSGDGHVAGGRDSRDEVARFLTGLGLGHYADTLEQVRKSFGRSGTVV